MLGCVIALLYCSAHVSFVNYDAVLVVLVTVPRAPGFYSNVMHMCLCFVHTLVNGLKLMSVSLSLLVR